MPNLAFAIGVFSDLASVNDAVKALSDAGVAKNEIAVVTKLDHPEEELIEDAEIKKADRHAKSWAEFGAIAGGLLGLLVGGVVFTAPAVGSMLVAGASLSGAINGLLGGAVVGGALFGISDGLIEWGMASADAKRLEELVAKGKVLVIVRGEENKVREAGEILKKYAQSVEILA